MKKFLKFPGCLARQFKSKSFAKMRKGIVMEITTKTFQTKKGLVEGIKTKWEGFSILLVTGSKGFLACPAIDIDACQGYGAAAAIVESTPDNPIGTLDRFPNRKVTKANAKAQALGIKAGMNASDAFELIA
jgi:uncharacterized protein YunC (DUF1805 family)